MTITLTMPEKFDFSLDTDFRKSHVNSDAKSFVIDLNNTFCIDSAALGILLQQQEHAGGQNNAVTSLNAATNIRKIPDIANFGQLMQINQENTG